MAFIGLRANPKKHERILKWLEKFDNQSEEVRRLLELGISLSEEQQASESHVTIKPTPIPNTPITWNFPKEPSVKE